MWDSAERGDDPGRFEPHGISLSMGQAGRLGVDRGTKTVTTSASKAARLLGRQGGKARAAASTPEQRKDWSRKGSDVTNAGTTPEQRSARGKAAVLARWAKRRAANASRHDAGGTKETP